MDNHEISDFYDDFSERQYKTGANERLISLYKRMLKAGLSNNSIVLELGCGVGIFTKLISKTVKNGKIEAVDLSPKSIEIAKKLSKNPKIQFETADVVKYQPKNKDFDFITLMDVIEHIPLEFHPELFRNLSENSTEKTLIAINIPNPAYIEYVRKTAPETLQVVDQSVELSEILSNAEKNGLEIIFYEKYSIWQKEDYDFMLLRKKKDFKLEKLSESRNISEKNRKQNQTENRSGKIFLNPAALNFSGLLFFLNFAIF